MQLAQQGKCRNVELSVSGPVSDWDDRIRNGWCNVTALLYCFCFYLFLAIDNFSMRKDYMFDGASKGTGLSYLLPWGFVLLVSVWGWTWNSARISTKNRQATAKFKRWSQLLFSGTSFFLAMEPTEPAEVSNAFVGYESDDEPLISLVTPQVSFKKWRKTLGGGAPNDPVSLSLGLAHLDTSDVDLSDDGADVGTPKPLALAKPQWRVQQDENTTLDASSFPCDYICLPKNNSLISSKSWNVETVMQQNASLL
jgi:hypothetical protein